MLIDAHNLKKILKNESTFGDWIKRHIKINNLKENCEYFIKEEKVNTNKRFKGTRIKYFLTFEACTKIIKSQVRNEIAKKIISELDTGKKIEQILEELSNEQEKIEIIKLEDENYPKRLKEIKNPPKQLYVKGNVQNLNEYAVAVIGSRDCSNYGRTICKIFTNNLVGYNLNIISGLAVGIDSVAHKSCIEAKGKTIAVLPSGFNKIFPSENQELLNKIIENGGTIVTEYPPDFEKTQESCKQRNRIMSGLAIATLVIEAEHRSGTSITVGYANEQNKKAFCVPSSLLNSKGIGTNEMILKKRAQIVTKAEDIINEFPELKLEKRKDFNFADVKTKSKQKNENTNAKIHFIIEEENLDVYNELCKGAKEINEIAKALNKPVNEVSYKLSMLELQGAIQKTSLNKYRVI